MNLSSFAKLQRVSNAAAAATTDINSDALDVREFAGAVFVVAFGTITASAVTSIHVEGSDDGSTGWTDLTGTNQAVADDDDNQLFAVDISNPVYPYLRCVVDRGTQNAVVDGIFALAYRADEKPVTHDSSTVGGFEFHDAPAAGAI